MAHKKKQKVAEPQPDTVDPFDTMMSALDWYFHVTNCHEHSNAERHAAFRAAHESFQVFVGDDPAMDAAANAPTTMTVN